MSNYVWNKIGVVIPNKERGIEICKDFEKLDAEEIPLVKKSRWGGYKIEDRYCIFQFETRNGYYDDMEEFVKKYKLPTYFEYSSDSGTEGIYTWGNPFFGFEFTDFEIKINRRYAWVDYKLNRIKDWIDPMFYQIFDDDEILDVGDEDNSPSPAGEERDEEEMSESDLPF